MLATLLLAATLDAPVNAVDDPGGWQSVKWGMTEEQVLQADPRASHLESTNGIGPKGDPASCRFSAVISSHQIAGDNFKVQFCFSSGKLTSVSLEPVIPEEVATPRPKKKDEMADIARLIEQTQKAAPRLHALEDPMIQKYGPPTEIERSRIAGTNRIWRFPTTKIMLNDFHLLYSKAAATGGL